MTDSEVIHVLQDEQLELVDAKRTKQYSRSQLSRGTRIILWALRIYVILMTVLIVVQLYLGFQQ